MDLVEDHQDKRSKALPELSLERSGIEEPDRDIDGFAVEAPTVAMNLARVDYRTPFRFGGRLGEDRVGDCRRS
jgi:hypothetical protein